MNEYDERAARRRAKAERITERVKKDLCSLIVDFRLCFTEFMKEVQERNKKLKKKEVAAADRDNDLEKMLETYCDAMVDKYEKRIVAFIREQLTSDDDRYL